MPRQPTGRPRGRPRGSGLGIGDEAPRLTIRMPADVYERLARFAEGYRYHRGDPPLAGCAREMILFCLDHPDIFRQPRNVPQPAQPHGDNFRQPENTHYRQPRNVPMPAENHGDYFRQPENVPSDSPEEEREDSRQPENITVPSGDHGDMYRQPEKSPAGYDASKFYLAPLCKRGHDYHGTGRSLLRKGNQNCVQCQRELRQARDARRTAAAQEGTR